MPCNLVRLSLASVITAAPKRILISGASLPAFPAVITALTEDSLALSHSITEATDHISLISQWVIRTVACAVIRQPEPPATNRPVGLGIRLVKDRNSGDAWETGRWRVQEIIPRFGADLSGLVRVGDVVDSIDKRRLDNVTEEDLAQIMCGPSGSSSVLGLLRPADPSESAAGASRVKAVVVRVTRVDPLSQFLEEDEREKLAVRLYNIWLQMSNTAQACT